MRVRLGGTVVSDDTAKLYRRYGYLDICCPNDIRNALNKCPEHEELIFEINSGGGSVYDGFEMYTVLRGSKRKTKCEIQSVAGSAASVFAVACDTVSISPVANMMIHRASTYAGGNSEEMKRTKQMLDTIDDSILTAYTEKCGDKCRREKIKSMMEEEKFFTAQEAIELGFADELMFQEDRETAMTRAAVAMCGGMSQVMARLPDIQELMQRDAAENYKKTGRPAKKEEVNMTMEELKAQAPELVQQIQQDAAKAERNRISAIEAVSMPGFEDLVNEAKNDPNGTAESVAMAMIARQKKQGEGFIANRAKDVDSGNVNGVEGSAKDETGAADRELNEVLDSVFGEA